MSDFKSKLPDFKELTSIAGKFYKDVKTSVCEIIDDYKQKREKEEAQAKTKAQKEKVATGSSEKPKKPTKDAESKTDKS